MQLDTALFEARLASLGISTKKDIPMSEYTTFRIGGRVQYALFPETKEALLSAVSLCEEMHMPCALVGCGSNLLWQDADFCGCVVFTTEMKALSVLDIDTAVYAEAGATLASLCLCAREHALSGLSFAFGIPGSVGGAVYMNAGAYDGEVGDRIASVTYFDLDTKKTETCSGADCAFGYRDSVFRHTRRLILSVTFSLARGTREDISREMEDYMARRRAKQPLNFPNAGSAFKRYPGYYTAKLIDEAGLRGYSVGGAAVSEKHAGFLINQGGATCADVLALTAHIEDEIRRRYGIEIEREIRLTEDCIL